MAERRARGTALRPVPAVSRAVKILRRLGASSEPAGVNQLARDLDLVPSTCLHILRVLVDEGLVDVDPVSKRYSIGVGILPIARSAIERNGFATLAQPVLNTLSAAYDVTAIATQLIDAQQMVVVALAQAQTPFRLSADIGSRFPALISATGRCVAAFGDFDEKTLRSRFKSLTWDHPPGYRTWRAQVAQARRDGYGVDRSEYISGVTIIAVPLFAADGSVSQGLVAVGMAEKLESAGICRIAGEMLKMRDGISALLMTD